MVMEVGAIETVDDTRETVQPPQQSCRCLKCGYGFVDPEVLSVHDLIQHTKNSEYCPVPSCEHHVNGFEYWHECARHVLQHYEARIDCGYCPNHVRPASRTFESADAFERHLVEVHDPFLAADESISTACPVCGTAALSAWDLSIHLSYCVIKELQQLHPSSTTEGSQQTKSSLETDYTRSILHTTTAGTSLSNVIDAGEGYLSLQPPRRGEKRQKNAAIWQCHLCPKLYTRPLALRAHVNNHKGERPFKCNVCELSFTRNNDRKTHEALHSGERGHVCTVCQRQFSRSSNLKRHSRKHAVKPTRDTRKKPRAKPQPAAGKGSESQEAALVLTEIAGMDMTLLSDPESSEYSDFYNATENLMQTYSDQ